MLEKYKLPDHLTHRGFGKFISHEEIAAINLSLGNKISECYKDQELVIINVLKGGLIFSADLIRAIRGVKIYVDFIKVEFPHQNNSEMSNTPSLLLDISTALEGKHVLIIKEIIDSGRTLSFVKNRVKLANPKSVKIVALLEKEKNSRPIIPDFLGKKIQDQFIIGFGLDVEGHGRNLKDILLLKYPN